MPIPNPKGHVTAQSLSVLSCQMGIITGNNPQGHLCGYTGVANWCLLLCPLLL